VLPHRKAGRAGISVNEDNAYQQHHGTQTLFCCIRDAVFPLPSIRRIRRSKGRVSVDEMSFTLVATETEPSAFLQSSRASTTVWSCARKSNTGYAQRQSGSLPILRRLRLGKGNRPAGLQWQPVRSNS
jgi:hypothetical protein